ncbi:XdhC family protein [Marinicella meishanensis]|uniref:XdhC family protein n=1 Tax=Marinicella meishanensis TaxID=2873263 RepID=UPI001CBB256F|nr:XdhC family protein [Marinicella sp. NBU2979]
MLEQIAPLWPTFDALRKQGEPLVLATLVSASGSSYKRPGAMLLIEANGRTHGLISGGCLEADVADHAEQVFADQQSRTLTYDMSDDSIFGLGAGCDGTLTLVLQWLHGDYLPLAALNPLPGQAQTSQLKINDGSQADCPIGAYVLQQGEQRLESHPGQLSLAANDPTVLTFRPPPHIVICGAGIDVYPLVAMLRLLHWHIEVLDHRPARLAAAELADVTTTQVSLNDLGSRPQQADSAVLIMTHNLSHDARYLSHFTVQDVNWIGLLGPQQRRDKVLSLAQLKPAQTQGRLHAPVGLDIGGHMPETIAVSIVAQLQHDLVHS